MKSKVRIRVLGLYNLILSVGATYVGILMLHSNVGIFMAYPKEWMSKMPFESWVPIGIIGIVIFGLGNFIAFTLCFVGKYQKGTIASIVMGGILFLCLIFQVLILAKWYLATVEFMLISVVQLGLGIEILHKSYKYRKMQKG